MWKLSADLPQLGTIAPACHGLLSCEYPPSDSCATHSHGRTTSAIRQYCRSAPSLNLRSVCVKHPLLCIDDAASPRRQRRAALPHRVRAQSIAGARIVCCQGWGLVVGSNHNTLPSSWSSEVKHVGAGANFRELPPAPRRCDFASHSQVPSSYFRHFTFQHASHTRTRHGSARFNHRMQHEPTQLSLSLSQLAWMASKHCSRSARMPVNIYIMMVVTACVQRKRNALIIRG